MQRLAIAGSAPDHSGYRRESDADPATPLQATIVLRSRDSGVAEALLSGRYDPSTHAASSAAEIVPPAIEAFAHDNGLTVQESDPAGRRVVVAGWLNQMSQAFGVRFGQFVSPDGGSHLSYDGEVTVPADIAPSILAVLGLDTRKIAR